jgi:hypothetical protein
MTPPVRSRLNYSNLAAGCSAAISKRQADEESARSGRDCQSTTSPIGRWTYDVRINEQGSLLLRPSEYLNTSTELSKNSGGYTGRGSEDLRGDPETSSSADAMRLPSSS